MLLEKNIENTSEKIYVGVSWPYANGNIHIGHLAGQYVVCDVFARYHRLKGNKVLMVSGSDSHGAPVVFKAEQLGITPQQLASDSHEAIVQTYKKLGFLYENYTTTTTDTHKIVSQNIFKVLLENGYLVVKTSKQYYDPKVERFLPDRYIKGLCPKCKANNARGDECPECGEYLEPEDLLEPYSTLSDTKPVIKETKHYYMDLRALQEPLDVWVTKASKKWRKWVREFSLGWIKQGLEPRPVTRDMQYGVPVPVDGWEDKVLYVWIEAVIGYLSASIEWAEQQGEPSRWEYFWKDPKCKHFYFIAGGNVPFHTILWPAELIAYNERYSDETKYEKYLLPGEMEKKPLTLPYNVPGNNMLFYKGKKMSKGDAHGITVDGLIERFGSDAIRYFFVKYAPEKQDREFIWKDFIDANNNELVATIGNFIYRTLSFCSTKFDKTIPNGKIDTEILNEIENTFIETSKLIESTEFTRSIERILELGRFANKYFNDQKPWETIKTEPDKTQQTIYNAVQLVNAFRLLLKPYTPFAIKKLSFMLNIDDNNDPNDQLELTGKVTDIRDSWKFVEIPVGQKLNDIRIIFPKFEYSQDLREMDSRNSEISEEAESLVLNIDPALKELPVEWKKYHNLKIKKLKPDQRKILDQRIADFIRSLPDDWKEESAYKGYRELHKKYSTLKEEPGSVEKLIEKIKKEGQLPKINSFVDIYNYLSIISGISIGAHDIDTLMGDANLKVLDENIDFEEIGTGEKNTAMKGEYAYVDQKGVLCRLDTKQSNRTRISEKTKNVLVILQGYENLEKDILKKYLDQLDHLLKDFKVSQ